MEDLRRRGGSEKRVLTPAAYYSLVALYNGLPKSGREIINRIEALSGQPHIVSDTTVYATLGTMVGQGFVEMTEGPNRHGGNHKNNPYQITQAGREELISNALKFSRMLKATKQEGVNF